MLDNFKQYQNSSLRHINNVQQRLTTPSEIDQEPADKPLVKDDSGPLKQQHSPSMEDEENEYSKRTCLDFSTLPWKEPEDVSLEPPMKLSPSQQKTHALLKNFSQDLKRAQLSLLNCNKPISQFPQAKWLNLLSRNAIDLDHVFSNIYTVSHNTNNVVKLGENLELLCCNICAAATETKVSTSIRKLCIVN